MEFRNILGFLIINKESVVIMRGRSLFCGSFFFVLGGYNVIFKNVCFKKYG